MGGERNSRGVADSGWIKRSWVTAGSRCGGEVGSEASRCPKVAVGVRLRGQGN